jgi:hypothetical protein
MDTEAALAFLAAHQPMPPDAQLSDDLIAEYDRVRAHFATVVEDRSVPLLLGSFGDGSGFGVYQLVEDALRAQDPTLVRRSLVGSLASSHRGVRTWSLEIAADYPDRAIVDLVKSLWTDLDPDQLAAAAEVLAQGHRPDEDLEFVELVLKSTDDEDVRASLSPIVDRQGGPASDIDGGRTT